MSESHSTDATTRGILLAAGAYVVTMGAAVLVVAVAVAIALTRSLNCGDMARALQILWGTIAVLCLISVIAVALMARRTVPVRTSRRTIVVAYSVVLLMSYLILALGLMVLFNC